MIDLQQRAVAAAHAAINAHDAKAYSALFAPDATVTEYGLGEVKGREAIAAGLQGALDGFPDYQFGVSRIYVKNDVLVQEWVMTGTNKGIFNGAPPTGKTIGVKGASVLTFTADGLIKTERRYFDTGEVLSQLGLTRGDVSPAAALPRGEPEWHFARVAPDYGPMLEVAKASFKTPAFPDAKDTYDSLFYVGDTVVSVASFTATHAGQLGPFKPTNKVVTLHAVDIMTVGDGKVESGTTYWNSFELLGQEGLLPKR
jgi:steroid delta-isomerase-like uncharacterized protein